MGLGKVGGYVGYDGGPEFVYDICESYWSVVIEHGRITFFLDEAGVAGHPLLWGVAVTGHALVEEEEGVVESVGNGL